MSKKEKALFDKMVAMLQEVAQSPTTEYHVGDDDPGGCIHCGNVSYRPHAENCLMTKVNNLLKEVQP